MARKRSLTLTDGELRIMEVLWKKGAATVAEVAEELAGKDGSAYTTVLTVLRNLECTLNPVALLALSSSEYSAAKHARGLKDLTGGLLLRAPSMWE